MCYNVIFFVAGVYFMNKINIKINIFLERPFYKRNKPLEAVFSLRSASCLTTPLSCSKSTVKHGFKGLIAFIKRLLHKNIHFNIYFIHKINTSSL